MKQITSHCLLLFSLLLLSLSLKPTQADASHTIKTDILPGFSDTPQSPPQPESPPNYHQNNSPPPSSDIFHSSPQIPIISPPPSNTALPESPQAPITNYPGSSNYPLIGSPPFGDFPNGGNNGGVGQGINNNGGVGQGINNNGGFGQGVNNGGFGQGINNGGFGQGINNNGGFGQGINNGGFGQQGFGGDGQYGDYGGGFLIERSFEEIVMVLIGVLFVLWV